MSLDERWVARSMDAVFDVSVPVTATVGEFANPWHDELGKFAPKGTGTKFEPGTYSEAAALQTREDVWDQWVRAATAVNRTGDREATAAGKTAWDYRSTGYSQNAELRAGHEGRWAERMDTAFDTFGTELTEPLVVARGVGFQGARDVMVAGTTYVDPAYISTTASKQVASDFARDQAAPADTFVMEVTIPPGVKVLPGNRDESEMILPRGLTFQIASVSGSTVKAVVVPR